MMPLLLLAYGLEMGRLKGGLTPKFVESAILSKFKGFCQILTTQRVCYIMYREGHGNDVYNSLNYYISPCHVAKGQPQGCIDR